jgi:hypothetical protein
MAHSQKSIAGGTLVLLLLLFSSAPLTAQKKKKNLSDFHKGQLKANHGKWQPKGFVADWPRVAVVKDVYNDYAKCPERINGMPGQYVFLIKTPYIYIRNKKQANEKNLPSVVVFRFCGCAAVAV